MPLQNSRIPSPPCGGRCRLATEGGVRRATSQHRISPLVPKPAPPLPSASPPARGGERGQGFGSSRRKRLMHNLSTGPASERGPVPSPASARRPCLSLVSGQQELIRAARARPKRVPARGRGRETQLCISLRKGGERGQGFGSSRRKGGEGEFSMVSSEAGADSRLGIDVLQWELTEAEGGRAPHQPCCVTLVRCLTPHPNRLGAQPGVDQAVDGLTVLVDGLAQARLLHVASLLEDAA